MIIQDTHQTHTNTYSSLSTNSEREKNATVRRSQRTPKKKVIKEYDFRIKPTRKKNKKDEKRLPQKVKLISNSQSKATLPVPNKIPPPSPLAKNKKESPKKFQKSKESVEHDILSTKQSQILEFNAHELLARNYNNRKKDRQETRPLHRLRYDGYSHLPEIDEDKFMTTRCKLEGCTGKTIVRCHKCNVHLCLKRGKNCFREFHILP